MSSEQERVREQLERAVRDWLRVKAKDEEDGADPRTVTEDPVCLGWVVVATYTSRELELAEATATAYDCAGGQPAVLSRGLSMAGVDRWAQG